MDIVLKCEICKKSFEVKPSRKDKVKYCGQECYHLSRRVPRVNCICKNCGKEFEVIEKEHARGAGKFCCRPCRSAWRVSERKKRNKKECEVCGKIFYPKPAYVRHGVKRCSDKCKSMAYMGSGHPLWSDTGRRTETSGYVSIRLDSGEWVAEHRYILETLLGRTLGSDEDVHHINRKRDDNRLVNLSILPRDKHRQLHNFQKIQEEYADDKVLVNKLQEKIELIEQEGRKEILAALN